ILFSPGADFENLIGRAEFNPVASRAAQQATLKAEKAGETLVDLEAAKNKGNADGGSEDDSTEEEDDSTGSGTPVTPGTGGTGGAGASGEE
ncbi:MAG: DNA-binding protein, partial [Prevotella sp.]|nr:DNA-binding protein [Prevotella sp.]